MINWIIPKTIFILFIFSFQNGLKCQSENKPVNLQLNIDTAKGNPNISNDSIVLYSGYDSSIFYKHERKEINYRDSIAIFLEASHLNIRGLYTPGWKIVNRARVDKLLEFMHENHFNNLIFDLKNANGELFFISTNELALKIQSQASTDEGRPRSIDIEYLKMRAKEKNIKLTGRHVMFRDKVLYNQKVECRLLEEQYWVDMRNVEVVNYNLALLKEESALGLDEIAIDYIRFPETNEFGTFDEKNEQIENIVSKSSNIFKTSESEFGLFVFGYVAWGLDMGIGQTLIGLEKFADRIYPMIYPSHFAPGTLGFDIPENYPYEIIDRSCQKSNDLMIKPKKAIPMLQAFWYSQNKLYLQLKAVHDNQMDGFVLWNATGNYSLYFTY